MATGGGCSGAPPPLVVVSAVRTRRVRRKCLRRKRGAAAAATGVGDWAEVPADILGTVLGLLPCLADRASVRSVCRHWRAAARVQALPAPLPVLVLPTFRFSSLTSDRLLTRPRRALMHMQVAGNDVRIVGSSDDWLMVVRSSRHAMDEIGDECFLVHAFSSEVVVHLPRLQSPRNYNCLDGSRSARRKEPESCVMLYSAALSASPSSGSKYIVAALCYHMAEPGLALWQPGMTSWYLYRSAQICFWIRSDLAFYEGKLYMVSKYTPDIFTFEIRENEHGVSLSCPEHYAISPLIPSKTPGSKRCNLVVWRGKLLLIIRFSARRSLSYMECNHHKVEVFALDFSTSPWIGVTQIHNFDGDCIFVQKSGCRTFSAGLHVGVQGDLIYFLDEECISNHVCYTCVHNMRDGTMRRFAAGLSLPKSGASKKFCLPFPVWIFPS